MGPSTEDGLRLLQQSERGCRPLRAARCTAPLGAQRAVRLPNGKLHRTRLVADVQRVYHDKDGGTVRHDEIVEVVIGPRW
eukprot:scaffold24701_cov59-Phaeocystis_antarctica.AAC.1